MNNMIVRKTNGRDLSTITDVTINNSNGSRDIVEIEVTSECHEHHPTNRHLDGVRTHYLIVRTHLVSIKLNDIRLEEIRAIGEQIAALADELEHLEDVNGIA